MIMIKCVGLIVICITYEGALPITKIIGTVTISGAISLFVAPHPREVHTIPSIDLIAVGKQVYR